MRTCILKAAGLLALLAPTLAMAQEPVTQRGQGTWEFSGGAGIKVMDDDLLAFLASGPASNRFTSDADPGRLMPAAAVRLGYNFSRTFGFSLGAEGASGSGVKYFSPFAAVTWTANLNAHTSPFITVGTQVTRIDGSNGRLTHPTWGAHIGLGLRTMMSQNLALRLEGRVATEHYAELPGSKSAYPLFATVGLSYFVGGEHAGVAAGIPGWVRVDTVVAVRVDTAWVRRVDTVRVRMYEPSPDQLVLRVQFRTNKAELLAKSRPVLDTIAFAIVATPASRWEVGGHTDDVGTAELNTALAQARAQSVVDYLVSRGVDRNALTAVGFGPSRPVFSNTTAYGRAQNRRVQLRRVPPPPTGVPVP